MTKDVREQIEGKRKEMIRMYQAWERCEINSTQYNEYVDKYPDQILALLKENGYVRLADEQTLPSIWYAGYGDKKPAEEAQQDMLNAGWKKVVE